MLHLIPALVYLLCALASALCTWLLLRNYRQGQFRLLLWTGVCFLGLTINNTLLFIDLVLLPAWDLSVIRALTALVGIGICIWGFVWEQA